MLNFVDIDTTLPVLKFTILDNDLIGSANSILGFNATILPETIFKCMFDKVVYNDDAWK